MIAVDDLGSIKEVRNYYFDKLLNEEFESNKDVWTMLSSTVSVPSERILEEVCAALAKAKYGKAAGQTGLVAVMFTASGETGVSRLTDLFDAMVKERCIPAD